MCNWRGFWTLKSWSRGVHLKCDLGLDRANVYRGRQRGVLRGPGLPGGGSGIYGTGARSVSSWNQLRGDTSTPAQIVVIQDWFEELKARVPSGP